jgi:2-methylcitrate dehydratase PrpD
MSSLSQRFAEFAAATRYPDIPPSARDRAGIHLLDTLGAGIAGSASREAAISREVAAGSPGGAGLWGTPATSAPLAAAFGNGVAAHAFELDDSGGCDHSGAVVVPALFAAAALSTTPVDGRTGIEAVVLGYDIARRVQSALGGYDELNEKGWHSTGVCGTFGAALAAGRTLGLDAGQLGHAIGLAGSFTGGTWAFLGNGAMSKRMHVGRAAETGLHCALLARSGFTGPSELFEAPWGGFLGLYGGDAADPGALVTDLGTDWRRWNARRSSRMRPVAARTPPSTRCSR